MTPSNSTRSGVVPLHHLLKRRLAENLLAEFKTLLPGVDLALIRTDGRLFASQGEWSQTDLTDQLAWGQLLAQASEEKLVQTADFLLQPLFLQSQLVGGVVARGLLGDSDQDLAPEDVLRCLQRSLTILLTEALEKQDVVQETLERYRELNLLYHIGETIGASLDSGEILQSVLIEANRVIRADVSAVLLPSTDGRDELQTQASLGVTEYTEALARVAQPLVDQVRHNARPDITTYSTTDSEPISVILGVPLKTQEQVLGVVLLGRLAGQPIFTASDEKLAMALASQAAIAIERTQLYQQEIKRQRLEQELAVGRQIQLSLLPASYPTYPGWEFAAIYQAAWQVGGDLYDFIELPADSPQLGLLIADVTGKGIPAALFMAFSRTIIRTEAMTSRNPATVLERANQLIIHKDHARPFLTAFYCLLDSQTGRLAYANGGHNWPLWLRAATGECQELTGRGSDCRPS
ncbi:MAG: SpoIIE family protein phosphatase [Chloroflexi bacterium]|nr:SpoIIE family protein phosphatase [Chloroflexota bacterium]